MTDQPRPDVSGAELQTDQPLASPDGGSAEVAAPDVPASGVGPSAGAQPPGSAVAARPPMSDNRLNSRQGVALGVAAALTLAGAVYSVSTLDSRQALAARSVPGGRPAPSATGQASPPGSASASASATGSGTAGTPSSPGPRAGADGLLLPPPPWERLSDATAKTGQVNLARAAEIDGHGQLSRTGLQQLGFSSGISRAWQAGGSVLLVLDYTFRDARSAAGFVTYGKRARDSDAGFRRLPVSGIPGAMAYRTSGAEPVTRVVLFSRGRSAFIVGVQGTPPAGGAGDLNVLARQQYDAAAG